MKKKIVGALLIGLFVVAEIVPGTRGSAIKDTQNIDINYIEEHDINDTVEIKSHDYNIDNQEQQKTETGKNKKERLQSFLEEYFTQFFNTMSENNTTDFGKKDFLSVNGYILGKTFVWKRELYKLVYDGIHTVSVNNVEVNEIQKKKDAKNMLEVQTYVDYEYVFGTKELCCCGGSYDVVIEQNGDTFTVRDLDNNDVIIGRVKSNLKTEKQKNNTSDDYAIIDEYFKKLEQQSEEIA